MAPGAPPGDASPPDACGGDTLESDAGAPGPRFLRGGRERIAHRRVTLTPGR